MRSASGGAVGIDDVDRVAVDHQPCDRRHARRHARPRSRGRRRSSPSPRPPIAGRRGRAPRPLRESSPAPPAAPSARRGARTPASGSAASSRRAGTAARSRLSAPWPSWLFSVCSVPPVLPSMSVSAEQVDDRGGDGDRRAVAEHGAPAHEPERVGRGHDQRTDGMDAAPQPGHRDTRCRPTSPPRRSAEPSAGKAPCGRAAEALRQGVLPRARWQSARDCGSRRAPSRSPRGRP